MAGLGDTGWPGGSGLGNTDGEITGGAAITRVKTFLLNGVPPSQSSGNKRPLKGDEQ